MRIVITGANSGIGFALTKALAREHEVVLMCRNEARARDAMSAVSSETPKARLHFVHLDLADFDSIHVTAAMVGDEPIDMLINNAGLYLPKREENAKGIESMMAINHLGPFLLTSLLWPNLEKSQSPRVINVASRAHQQGKIDFGNLQGERKFSAFRQYGTTKLCNILFTKSLATRSPINTYCYHPGVVATGFGHDKPSALSSMLKFAKIFLRSPEQGADTGLFLASQPAQALQSGGYYVDRRQKTPSKQARDPRLAEELWRWSEEQVATRFL